MYKVSGNGSIRIDNSISGYGEAFDNKVLAELRSLELIKNRLEVSSNFTGCDINDIKIKIEYYGKKIEYSLIKINEHFNKIKESNPELFI